MTASRSRYAAVVHTATHARNIPNSAADGRPASQRTSCPSQDRFAMLNILLGHGSRRATPMTVFDPSPSRQVAELRGAENDPSGVHPPFRLTVCACRSEQAD